MASIENRWQQLESRLRQLENMELIRRTLAQYCRALDARDLKTMSTLFSRDAELVVDPWSLEFRGHQAIIEFYDQYFHWDLEGARHYYANEHIEADGDGYKSVCYFHEIVARGSDSFVGWGTYRDTFMLEQGVWRFRRKLITILALTPIDKGWARADKIVQFS